MAISPTTLAQLLAKLQIDNDQSSVLKELKTAIISLPSDDLERLIDNTSFGRIFDCLNTTDREQICIACDLLTKLLSSLKPSVVLTQFHVELHRGLSHPEPNVKQMVLKQLQRCAANERVLMQLSNSSATLLSIVKLLADSDMGVSKQASEVVVEMGKNHTGLIILSTPPFIQEFKNLMKKSDIIRFRVYELSVKLSKLSPENLLHCINSGMVPALLTEFHQQDIVLQLNCLELLSELTLTEHGVRYLEEQGTIKELETMLNHVDTDPLASFLIPGLTKFFGNMGFVRPKEVIDKYPGFIISLIKSLENNDPSLLGVAVETVSILGSTVDGKMALEKLGERMTSCMKRLGSLMANSPSAMRVKAMNATESLLDLRIEDQTTELLALTESWFRQLSASPMQLIMGICRQPFSDLHGAALGVICALAKQPWGQHEMNNFPGFFEYILDRSTEADKEGKELKYEIVKQLVLSPTAQQIFGNLPISRLKEYYQEGPFYVPALTEVAFEGAS